MVGGLAGWQPQRGKTQKTTENNGGEGADVTKSQTDHLSVITSLVQKMPAARSCAVIFRPTLCSWQRGHVPQSAPRSGSAWSEQEQGARCCKCNPERVVGHHGTEAWHLEQTEGTWQRGGAWHRWGRGGSQPPAPQKLLGLVAVAYAGCQAV